MRFLLLLFPLVFTISGLAKSSNVLFSSYNAMADEHETLNPQPGSQAPTHKPDQEKPMDQDQRAMDKKMGKDVKGKKPKSAPKGGVGTSKNKHDESHESHE